MFSQKKNYFSFFKIKIKYFSQSRIYYFFTENVSEVIVTWSTFNPTPESIVEYGIGDMILTAKGGSNIFVDGGKKKHTQYIHRVHLKNLQPKQKYGELLNSINFNL